MWCKDNDFYANGKANRIFFADNTENFMVSFSHCFILSFFHFFILHIRSGHKRKAPKLVRGSLVYRKRLLHQDFDFVELFPARHSNTSITLLSLNQDLSSFLYVDSFLRIDNPAALEVEVFSFL